MNKHIEEFTKDWELTDMDDNGLFPSLLIGPKNSQGDREDIGLGFNGPTGVHEHIARRILAAPDMLEALLNLENDAGQIGPTAWKMVHDAIEKATGVRDPRADEPVLPRIVSTLENQLYAVLMDVKIWMHFFGSRDQIMKSFPKIAGQIEVAQREALKHGCRIDRKDPDET